MKHRLLSIMSALALCFSLFTVPALAFTFEEVPAEEIFSPEIIEREKVSDWALSEIELARQAGLLTEHTQSYMTHSATRLQFAELIVNMAEKVTGKTIAAAPDTTFTDCKDTAVLKAYSVGIVSGVGDGKFEPDTTTNREQIAAMIYRAITYIEKGTGKEFTNKTADLAKFSDKGSVSAWAAESVGILAANGIMSGTSATTLAPKDPCALEQSILLIYRVYQQAQVA